MVGGDDPPQSRVLPGEGALPMQRRVSTRRSNVFAFVVPRGCARGLMMTALSKQMPWLEYRVVSASGLPALRRRGPVSNGSIRFDTVFIIGRCGILDVLNVQ